MQQHTDQYYIDKILQGDTQAFEVLVERYQSYIYTIVVRMVRVKEEAEEIAQDTFIKAYQSIASFRGESKFSSWLYSIAYRKALDSIRKNKKYKAAELNEEITEGSIEIIENALTYIEDKEKKELIQKCILKLPEQEAAIITLFYFEEQSIKEIAKITQLTEDNIKVKLYRSRKKCLLCFNILKYSKCITKMEKTTKEVEKSVFKLVKEAGVSIPSADFLANVMTAVASQSTVQKNYQPLISNKVWFGIAASLVICIVLLNVFTTTSTGYLDQFSFTDKLSFNVNLPEIKVSKTMMYGIGFLSLFLLQIPFIKYYHNKRYI
jgi:RNA polymerase sigma-70 factor (ECF subfamily)